MNVERFLTTQRIARLATISRDGAPHLVPVVYVYHGKHIYIALDEKPKRVSPLRLQRVQNILAYPRVALLVDRYDEDWSQLAWVRVDGTARIFQRGKTHARAIALLRKKYSQYRAMNLEEQPVIVIAVKKIAVWEAKEG